MRIPGVADGLMAAIEETRTRWPVTSSAAKGLLHWQAGPGVIVQDDHFDTDPAVLCLFTTSPPQVPAIAGLNRRRQRLAASL